MAKGIVRRIDELGRITLPKEYRDTYGLRSGKPLGMLIEDNVISLIKPGEKFIGIIRNLDELGRYTLPIETRRVLGLENGQKVDIFIDGMKDSICIRKDGCEWCNNTDDLIEVNGHHLCISCASAVTSTSVKVLK